MTAISVHNSAKLKHKLQEVYAVEPNDLGLFWLTFLYKKFTHRLKDKPFLYIIPLAFIVTAGLYFLFGQLVVKLTSLLQYGS
jgi:hypothetical protein